MTHFTKRKGYGFIHLTLVNYMVDTVCLHCDCNFSRYKKTRNRRSLDSLLKRSHLTVREGLSTLTLLKYEFGYICMKCFSELNLIINLGNILSELKTN